MTIRQKLTVFITVVLAIFFFGTRQVSAKELSKVISNLVVWDKSSNSEAKKTGGTYVLTEDVPYALRVNFDLAAYDGNMQNGDSFTSTISAPLTLTAEKFELTESKSGKNIAIADVEVTPSGSGQGGTLKLTLKNLDAYLAETGLTSVRDISGFIFAEFTSKETKNVAVPVTLDKSIDGGNREVNILVLKRGVSDYSGMLNTENYAKLGGVYTAKAYDSAILGKKGTHVHPWRIRVNTSKKTYTTLTVEDVIGADSAPMQIIPENIRIRSSELGFHPTSFSLQNAKVLTKDVDYTVSFKDHYTKMEITLLNVGDKAFQIEYDTTAPGGGLLVGNTATMNEGGVALVNNTRNNQMSSSVNEVISGSAAGGQIILDASKTISIVKVDEATLEPLAGAVFTVTKPDGTVITLPPTNAKGVTQSPVFTDAEITAGDFTITEVVAPKHYDLSSAPIKVRVGAKGVTRTVANKKRETVTIEVTKKWDDQDDNDAKRPNEVVINLVDDKGQTVDRYKVTKDNNWKVSFEADKFDANGAEINYTITEDPVSGYQTPTIVGDMKLGFTITNTRAPELTSHQIEKIWDDNHNQDGKRPTSLQVQLYQSVDGAAITPVTGKTLTLNNGGKADADTWTASFQDLPRYEAGKEITYSAQELATPADYTVAYQADMPNKKTIITNSYKPQVTDITATKVWDDANNQDGKRPTSIKIHLIKTVAGVETVVASKDLTMADNWTTVFTNQPVNEAGQRIAYSIREDRVTGYTTLIKDFVITNSYSPETVDYKVTKKWQDDSNRDGKRPDQITIQLYQSIAGGVETAVAGKTLTLTAAQEIDPNTWEASFTRLPKYEAGQEIHYSVKEDDATLATLAAINYTPQVNGQEIINSYTPETVKISGTKVWDDDNNRGGKRPASITVRIMNGDLVVDDIQVTEANGWAFESKELPKYANGQELVYSVEEVVVADYTASQNRGLDGKYILTNTYRPSPPLVPTPPTSSPQVNPSPTSPSAPTPPSSSQSSSDSKKDSSQADDGTKGSDLSTDLTGNDQDTGQTGGGTQVAQWHSSADPSSSEAKSGQLHKNLPKTGHQDNPIFAILGLSFLLMGVYAFAGKKLV